MGDLEEEEDDNEEFDDATKLANQKSKLSSPSAQSRAAIAEASDLPHPSKATFSWMSNHSFGERRNPTYNEGVGTTAHQPLALENALGMPTSLFATSQ